VHFQKIFNALSTSCQYFTKKVCFWLTPKHVETHCWVANSEFQVDRPATAEHRRPNPFRQ